jgi:hypothetical protein
MGLDGSLRDRTARLHPYSPCALLALQFADIDGEARAQRIVTRGDFRAPAPRFQEPVPIRLASTNCSAESSIARPRRPRGGST